MVGIVSILPQNVKRFVVSFPDYIMYERECLCNNDFLLNTEDES